MSNQERRQEMSNQERRQEMDRQGNTDVQGTVTGRMSSGGPPAMHEMPEKGNGFGDLVVKLMDIMSDGAMKDIGVEVDGVADAIIPTIEDMAAKAMSIITTGAPKDTFMDASLEITIQAKIMKRIGGRVQDNLMAKMEEAHQADVARKAEETK